MSRRGAPAPPESPAAAPPGPAVPWPGWIPWGSIPRRYGERGLMTDAHGSFRLEAAECVHCKIQLSLGTPAGAHPACPHCGCELRRVLS